MATLEKELKVTTKCNDRSMLGWNKKMPLFKKGMVLWIPRDSV